MIDRPDRARIPELLGLWKESFGDWGGFWELFLDTAFSADRCRCLVEEGRIAAALCWLDCRLGEEKIAYVYAVLTRPDCRGRGLCRKLLADTHGHLKSLGYRAAMLVPEGEGLRAMYAGMGYETWTSVTEFSCPAGPAPLPLRPVGPEEYASLRRKLLPAGGVLQEGENLPFLAGQVQFYAGEGVLLAAYTEDAVLHGMELLGDRALAPAVVAALDCREGRFRCPGGEKPFAMGIRLQADARVPEYFGIAFD